MLNGESGAPAAASAARSGPLAVAVSKSLALSLQTVMLPYQLALRWLAWWAGLGFNAFAMLGATPQGFVPQAQMRELTAVVEHMHLREDLYRKHIAELQEELDARDSDKKKALKKLKKTKLELDLLSEQIADLQQQHGSGARGGHMANGHSSGYGQAGTLKGSESRAGLHASMAVLLASVWWFYQSDQPAVQRKLLFAVLFPLCWIYVQTLLTRRPPFPLAPLLCTCWTIIGFVAAHKLAPSHGYD